MSEYAKQCPKYWNVYHVKQKQDCINCYYSDETAWSTCSIPELKWKQARFKIAQVAEQKQLFVSQETMESKK